MQWVITEWKADKPGAAVFSGRAVNCSGWIWSAVFRWQEITFNPLQKKGDEDYGLLYIGIGDGGAVKMAMPGLRIARKKSGDCSSQDPAGRTALMVITRIPPDNPCAKSHADKIAKKFMPLVQESASYYLEQIW